MAIVDVRAHLTDPSNAKQTTKEINDMSLAVSSPTGFTSPNGPGGTLFFSAGDYHIQAMEAADLDPAFRTSPYAVDNQNIINHWGQGGIQIRPGVSYVGEPGTRLLWSETGSGHDTMMSGNASIFGAVSPFAWESSDYVDATIDAVVAAGQRAFSVDQNTGFSEGDAVIVQLGYVPDDKPEFIWWSHATVVPTDGDPADVITLDRPALIPVQSMDFGDPDVHTAHLIRKVNRVVENIEIRNFEILQNPDLEVVQPEIGILVHYARGVRVENVIGTNLGAGIVIFQYSERVAARNVHMKAAEGASYYGRGMGFANSRTAVAEDVTFENFRSVPIFAEHQCTQIQLRNVHFVNYNTDREISLTDGLIVTSFESEVHVDGLTVEGFGGYNLSYIAGNAPLGTNRFAIDDIFLRTVPDVDGDALPGYPARVQMRNLGGTVRHDRAFGDFDADGTVQLRYRFKEPRVWSKEIAIPVNDDSYDVLLPDGLLRRGRISYGDWATLPGLPDGLVHIYWVNGDLTDHKIDLRPQFVNADEQTVEFSPRVTALGPPELDSSEDAFGEQLIELTMGSYIIKDRFLRIHTSSEMPAGKKLTIWLEYFPYEQEYGSRDDNDGAYTQSPAI